MAAHSVVASAYQVVGPGFEPGLEILLFSQPVGRGFELCLRHVFFAISVWRKITGCLAGVLFFFEIQHAYNGATKMTDMKLHYTFIPS